LKSPPKKKARFLCCFEVKLMGELHPNYQYKNECGGREGREEGTSKCFKYPMLGHFLILQHE
jgi:hypothetical protein